MKKIIFLAAVFICSLFAVNQSASALTYTVTVPEGTQTCYFTGDANGWSFTKMEAASAANQFTITVDNATETQGYKYLSGPGWEYEEAKDAEGNSLDENRTYADSNGNDVVAYWKSLFVPETRTVTIEVWVPSAVHVLYIVGSFNNWSGKFDDEYKMEYVGEEDGGKIFSIQITYDDVDNMEFKLVAGPDWSFEQTATENFKYSEIEESAPNTISLAVYEFKAIFDPTRAGDIHIKATVPAGTSRVWIQGSFLGWSWDDPKEMTKNADGTFSYTIPIVQQIEYRLYNGADWQYAEAEEGDLNADRSNRAATFDPEDPDKVNEITVWAWRTAVSAIPSLAVNPVKVYSSAKGQLTVAGASQVEIFDIVGKRIQSAGVSGDFVSNTLHPGIYIVRADGVSQKVIVK
jgi:hypothetical protein